MIKAAFRKGYSLYYVVWTIVPVCLAKLCDMRAEARLKVCSLIFVDDVSLSKLVQHLLDRGVQLDCLFLVAQCAQLAHGIAHGLCIVFVVQSLHLILTDALK